MNVESHRSPVTILSLNMRFGLAEDGVNNWQHRKAAFPELFHFHTPDFICLQEVNDFQFHYLETLLSAYTAIGRRSPAPRFWQNNIIFFHKTWRCEKRAHLFLSATPEVPSRFMESRWPRQFTVGYFTREDVSLVCVNTHFDFDADVQTRSAGIILDHLQQYRMDIPAILCGDFNATPTAPCYALLTGQPEPALMNPRLEPFFENVFSAPYPGTFHGFTGIPNGKHIDWILYRGKIKKQNSRVIKEKFSGYYPSDHFPISAGFRFVDSPPARKSNSRDSRIFHETVTT